MDHAYIHEIGAAIVSLLLIGVITVLNALKLIIGVPSAAIATVCLGSEEPGEGVFCHDLVKVGTIK